MLWTQSLTLLTDAVTAAPQETRDQTPRTLLVGSSLAEPSLAEPSLAEPSRDQPAEDDWWI